MGVFLCRRERLGYACHGNRPGGCECGRGRPRERSAGRALLTYAAFLVFATLAAVFLMAVLAVALAPPP